MLAQLRKIEGLSLYRYNNGYFHNSIHWTTYVGSTCRVVADGELVTWMGGSLEEGMKNNGVTLELWDEGIVSWNGESYILKDEFGKVTRTMDYEALESFLTGLAN